MSNPKLAEGNFYYFLRTPGPAGLGHMGWGFETTRELRACVNEDEAPFPSGPMLSTSPSTTRQWYFGSMENAGGSPAVGPGGDNDYWTSVADSEAQMLHEMRTMTTGSMLTGRPGLQGYTAYKKIPVRNADPIAAERLAQGWAGYFVLFNNCLDNAAKIGDAYGVRVWSWARHLAGVPGLFNVPPRGYFSSTLWEYPSHEL